MDFTLKTYRSLLLTLKESGYSFLTFETYCQKKEDKNALPDKFVILRHDVDLKAVNSLATAKIEAELGVRASYFFRVIPESNKPDIIRAIVALEHEIGYHYEDMTICNGNVAEAVEHFQKQLAYFRQYYPVKTICMHGALRSKYVGKDLWKIYNYHDFGIIGEPYLDTDFSQIFYLTDTGRQWDGYKFIVYDKIPVYQDKWIAQGLVFHTTNDIIQAVQNEILPSKIMFTTHPQRWTDNGVAWLTEWGMQTLKNQIKRLLIKK